MSRVNGVELVLIERLGDLEWDKRRTLLVTVWFTLAIVLMSLAVTYSANFFFGDGRPGALSLLIATSTPALIVPFACYFNFRLFFRLRAANQHLAILSETDYLTNTLNRRRFVEVAERELALARRHGYPTTVLLLDFDHFKTINDKMGHQVGDEVLVRSIDLIKSMLRQADVIGRFGGEEFVVLLPHTSSGGAAALAERIRAAVSKSPAKLASEIVAVTVSIGSATCDTSQSSLEFMIKNADELLYESKARGRNCCAGRTITPESAPPIEEALTA